jgi:hypothetical protein
MAGVILTNDDKPFKTWTVFEVYASGISSKHFKHGKRVAERPIAGYNFPLKECS